MQPFTLRLLIPLTLVVLLLAGCSLSDSTSSEEYQALEQELTEAEQQLADTEQQLGDVTAERDALAEEGAAEAIAVVEANETATIEAFLAKDLDALADTWTEDYIFVDETFGDYVEGKAANRAMNASVIKYADPDKTRVLDRFVSEDGTFAVSTWEWIGTNDFGKPFDLPYAIVAEYRDGKIAKHTIYYASPDAYGQLMGG